MKGIHIFCASQSATAICLSMEAEHRASPSSCFTPAAAATILLGSGSSPAIDRHNPIITDSSRRSTSTQIPPPVQNNKNNKKKKINNKKIPKIPLKENGDQIISKKINININDDDGEKIKISGSTKTIAIGRKSWRCTKPGDFISPPGSTRYLLSDQKLLDFDPPLKSETSDAKPPPSSASPDQVVVLRVSLHCRGCEKKMRKHISRMEGVTSFNIDFAAKKVTVAGKVTPVEVLSSISKVKNAQLWPPTISSSTPPPPPPPPSLLLNRSNTSEFKNEYNIKGAYGTDLKVV